MKQIVNWLREVEHLAYNMYQKAASIYSDDKVFRKFLEVNAEDESWHYHVMGSAVLFLESIPDITPSILIDKTTHDKVAKQIRAITTGLEQKSLSKSELIDKIVELELSEWNDIFLYAVSFLKEKSSEFKYPVSRIQAHVKEIEFFLSQVEHRQDSLDKIKQLPPIWIERILIVDDEKMLTDLIRSILNRSGNIDIAHSGQEALELVKKNYYKLIITDIDMPKMDGITFYNKVVEMYPESKCRFLFMTGCLTSDRQDFLDKNQLKCLKKPMSISEVKEEAAKILLSQLD